MPLDLDQLADVGVVHFHAVGQISGDLFHQHEEGVTGVKRFLRKPGPPGRLGLPERPFGFLMKCRLLLDRLRESRYAGLHLSEIVLSKSDKAGVQFGHLDFAHFSKQRTDAGLIVPLHLTKCR